MQKDTQKEGDVRDQWDVDRVDTPALLVDLDVVEANLRREQDRARAHGLALWPHTKTHKSTFLAQRQVALGAAGITVAKVGEAEVMRASGLSTILIAYPLVGTLKAERLAKVVAAGTAVRVAVDSREAALTVSHAARLAGAEIEVLLEVDTGFHRVGVPPGAEAVPLVAFIERQAGLRFRGLTSFAGHVSGAVDEEGRRRILGLEADALAQTRDLLMGQGFAVDVVSVGGTHHGARMEAMRGATEIRPGTYVYNDRNTLLAGSCREEDCAATILATVVSAHPTWAVVDAGSKTLSSDTSPFGGFGLVRGRPEITVERMSEEHGILVWPHDAPPLTVGERLHIIPNHICPVVNLHDSAVGLRKGRLDRILTTDARGQTR